MEFQSSVNAPQPNTYVGPLVDFSPIGNLPDTYYKGQQAQREEDKQTLFRNGIPKTPGGDVDYGSMAEQLYKMGDFQTGTSLANTGIQRSMLNEALKPPSWGQTGRNDNPGQAGGPSTTTQQPGSQNTTGNAGQENGGGPLPGAAGGDNGKSTVMAVLGDAGFPADSRATGVVAGEVAKRLGVDPNQPLSAEQMKQASALAKTALFNMRRSAGQQQGTPGGGPGAGSPAPTPAAPGPDTGLEQGASAAPPVRQAQAQGTPGQGLTQLNPAIEQLLPPPFRNGNNGGVGGAISGLESEAARLAPLGAYGKQKSEQFTAMAKQIREAVTKYGEPTPAMKDLAQDRAMDPNSGQPEGLGQREARVAGDKTLHEEDSKAFTKNNTAIQSLGHAAGVGQQKVALAKELVNSPDFYSGPLEPTNRLYKQWLANFGKPSAAVPQEAFNKIVNDMLAEQVKAMGQAGVGRVLLAEVQTMKQAIASLGITPASNRILLETVDRVYKANERAGEIGRSLRVPPGALRSPALAEAIARDEAAHPLFSPAELRDPRLIAPPRVMTPADAQKLGVSPGDPIEVPKPGGGFRIIPYPGPR